MPKFTRNRIKFCESRLASVWWQAVGKEFISTEGKPVKVIYPGRNNARRGPDFLDAVVLFESELVKGDVEIHATAEDWYAHGHHIDDEYNQVILHVAMYTHSGKPTLTKEGKAIPLVCLSFRLMEQSFATPPSELPCRNTGNSTNWQSLIRQLDIAGEQRFKGKVTHFQAQLRHGQPGQVLFRGMMRALGYAQNTLPFEDLAERMPLDFLENRRGLFLKQALLLGTAGLLPSQRQLRKSASEAEAQELEAIWRSLGRHAAITRQSHWNLSQIYPNNSPVRRIVALCYLLERYHELKLLRGILELVSKAPFPDGHRFLEAGLIVAGDGYWRDHFDFGMQSKTKPSALLGKNKADEIIVNVVLPFAFSWAQLIGEPKLRENALQLYRHYPKLAENCLTCHMARQLQLKHLSDLTACRQQGLIHIFQKYCREGECNHCLLGERAGS